MHELDGLGKELQSELGPPPADWAQRQRRRLRGVRVGRAPQGLRRQLVPALALAGVLLVSALLVGVWPRGTAEILSATGATTSVWLDAESSTVPYRSPDGSTMRLDAGSQGRFSSDAEGAMFDLHQGRGHFTVAKRPGQNWTVVAGRYKVHVVGTRFSVSYDKLGDLGVSVSEGRVKVHVPQRGDPILLEAGDQLNIKQDQLSLVARADQLDDPNRQATSKASQGDGVDSEPSATQNGAAPTKPKSAKPRSAASSRTPINRDAPASEQDWRTLYELRQYRAALERAKAQGFQQLTQTLSAPRLVELADTARLGGDSSAALLALRALESRFPGTAAAADAGFLIGRLHAQRGESAAAIQRLTAYLERGKNARYTLEAMGRLMELHTGAGRVNEARVLAQRYLQRAPKGPYQRLAESILEQR